MKLSHRLKLANSRNITLDSVVTMSDFIRTSHDDIPPDTLEAINTFMDSVLSASRLVNDVLVDALISKEYSKHSK